MKIPLMPFAARVKVVPPSDCWPIDWRTSEWIHEDEALPRRAAEIKATHRLSLADAWIGACAMQQDALLMHKDPEFEALEIEQFRLPYKPSGSE